MQRIFDEIDMHRMEFERLSFFQFLEVSDRLESAKIFVPGLAFFVLTFQDILRLNEQHVSDPNLIPFLQRHRQEDLGHDEWFLHDLRQLGTECHARLLFGEQFIETRDTAFEIISEIYRASDDRVRFVIPFVLEAAGSVFFSRVFHYFERSRYQGKLKYFSKDHFQVEQAHDLHEKQVSEPNLLPELKQREAEEVSEMIRRIFQSLSRMLAALHLKIEQQECSFSRI